MADPLSLVECARGGERAVAVLARLNTHLTDGTVRSGSTGVEFDRRRSLSSVERNTRRLDERRGADREGGQVHQASGQRSGESVHAGFCGCKYNERVLRLECGAWGAVNLGNE